MHSQNSCYLVGLGKKKSVNYSKTTYDLVWHCNLITALGSQDRWMSWRPAWFAQGV